MLLPLLLLLLRPPPLSPPTSSHVRCRRRVRRSFFSKDAVSLLSCQLVRPVATLPERPFRAAAVALAPPHSARNE